MYSRHRNRALAVLTATALATLTGCASLTPVASSPHTAVPLSGVIATGKLVSVRSDDPVTGAIAVLASPLSHTLTIRLTGMAGNLGTVSEVLFSSAAVKAGTTCTPYGLAYSAGSLSTGADEQLTVHADSSPGWENPSFLHSVILTGTVPSTNECASGMIAYAPLAWTVGDPRPDIHVLDKGSRPGATGHPAEVDGTVRSYVVVAGDNLDSIAARFNLTPSELFYLNPARTPSPLSTVVKVGEILNLSKSNR